MLGARALTPPSLFISLLLLAGCPGGAGSLDGGSDAGAVDDAGPSVDSGPNDAGPPLEDAGPDPIEDGGVDEPDGGSCALPDPCEGAAVTGGVRFETGGEGATSFGPGNTASLTLGESTRSLVEAAFGTPVTTDNPFRAWYCAHGVRVEYVDDVSGSDFEGTASPADVVARVVTLSGAVVSSSNEVTLGVTRAFAQAQLTTPLSVDLEYGGFDASATDGMTAISDDDGIVTTLALFVPQAAALWNLSIDVASAAIGAGATRVARSDALSTADAALGTGYDAQGIVSVDVGSFNLDFLVRIYAAYGIRLVAACPVLESCNADSANIQQIVLSPPFIGEAPNGQGLGDLEESFVAAYGAGQVSSQSEDVMKYTGTGGRTLGVAYVTDAACQRRAGAVLLNYTDPG